MTMHRQQITSRMDPALVREIEDAVDAANEGVKDDKLRWSRSSALEHIVRQWSGQRVRCTRCRDLGCRRCPEQEVAR